MSQPPDNDFYNSSTENAQLPPQQWSGRAPGYPQRPSAPNYPPQQNFPNNQGPVNQLDFPTQRAQNFPSNQGPASQPGFGPQNFPPNQGPASQPGFGPQNFSPNQGPASQPGFGPQNFSLNQGPTSQPGFGPQNVPNNQGPRDRFDFPTLEAQGYPPNQGGFPQQRQQNFPPPQRPINQPGFSQSGYQQQGSAPAFQGQQPPWSGNQPGPSNFPGQQPPNTPFAGGGFSTIPEQGQFGVRPDWQKPAQQPPPKKSRLGLVITILIILVVIVVGAGSFLVLRPHGNDVNTATTPTTSGTSTTNGVTPVTTRPTTGTTPTTGTSGGNGIGTPVQAGAIWVVTVTSARATTTSLLPPNAGSTYLEINLSLKNISGQSQTLVSFVQFSLNDAAGKVYHETAADTNIHRPPDGNVNSGQTLDAQIAFEVPKSQHTFTLTFAYGLGSGSNASVSWRFSV